MWGIIKKDIARFAINMLIVPVAGVYWLATRDQTGMQIVVPMAMLIFLVITSSVAISELNEEKNNGYRFLGMLPTSGTEVVAAKFALPLVVVIILVGFDTLVIAAIGGTPDTLALARAVLVFSGLSSLVLVGLIYITVFMYGYTQVMRYGLVMFMAILLFAGTIAQLLIKQSILPELPVILQHVTNLLLMINPLLLAAVGIAIYAGMMYFTIRVKGTE